MESKNANFGEALKCLEEIKYFTYPSNQNECVEDYYDNYSIIKQALLKAQEQKEILEILKPYFKSAVFPSAINFNFSEEEFKKLKEVFSK